MKSCAHWLNWKCGIDLGAAREKVRVARALAGLPRIAAAMAEGQLSYAKVRAMSRVADTANETYLLNIALCGTASHVEDVVRGYRRALDAAELSREVVQQRDQNLWWHAEPDGSMVIRGRLPAEIGSPAPTPTAWSVLVATHQDCYFKIDAQTAVTRWTGESLDLDVAVAGLLQRSAPMAAPPG